MKKSILVFSGLVAFLFSTQAVNAQFFPPVTVQFNDNGEWTRVEVWESTPCGSSGNCSIWMLPMFGFENCDEIIVTFFDVEMAGSPNVVHRFYTNRWRQCNDEIVNDFFFPFIVHNII